MRAILQLVSVPGVSSKLPLMITVSGETPPGLRLQVVLFAWVQKFGDGLPEGAELARPPLFSQCRCRSQEAHSPRNLHLGLPLFFSRTPKRQARKATNKKQSESEKQSPRKVSNECTPTAASPKLLCSLTHGTSAPCI